MKVTFVNLAPAPGAADAPALSPEMLAAVGARYSRDGEGLDAILGRVAGMNPDTAVDSIFKMVDYGHASIADMAPVALFIDGISLWLAWRLWALSPRAAGQETSTRYVRYSSDGVISAEMAGIPQALRKQWQDGIASSFGHYEAALALWQNVAHHQPDLVRIPAGTPPKAKQRMERNFAFDRARYWLPAAALTNMMMILPARDWVMHCQDLLSHPSPECVALGELIKERLGTVTPRLVRHAKQTPDRMVGHRADADILASVTDKAPWQGEKNDVRVDLELFAPENARLATPPGIALAHHPHRYAWVGAHLARWTARFTLDGVAFAEQRDLNRHRTGSKWQPRAPVGFYGARDQAAKANISEQLQFAVAFGIQQSQQERTAAIRGESHAPYWGLLGTQYPYERTTSLDKLVYEIELRTGTGAHWRYAEHYAAVHKLLTEELPEIASHVRIGTAEPE